MNPENKLEEYIENLWLKDGLIVFPKREEIEEDDESLDLSINIVWLLWEKEMHS